MKKLLSLLSVLIISGTAIPTTIAASPYQKEETIKNIGINYQQTNNIENLIRNKREKEKISLEIPHFKQLLSSWCGPAVAQAVLEFRNINLLNIFAEQRLLNSTQRNLSNLMNTDNIAGTIPRSLLEVLNTFIDTYVTVNSRNAAWARTFYQQTDLMTGNINLRTFYELVHNSLINNNPVILGFSGTLPGQADCQTEVNHYIIIYGMTIVDNNNNDDEAYKSVNYIYSDPGTGLNEVAFTGDDLIGQVTHGWQNSVLLHHDGNIAEWNNNNRNNTQDLEQPMEFGFAPVRCEVINQVSQRKKRSNEGQIKCISKKEFYFDKNKNDQTIYTYHRAKVSYWTQWNFNLKNINPLSFDKIEILFDNIDDIYTKISLGNDNSFGTKITDFFKDKYIKDIIKNVKVDNNENDINKYSTHELIKWKPSSTFVSYQRIGLTFYWENGNYYLQLLIFHYAENDVIIFPDGGGIWLGIGKGIKLYSI